MGQNTATIECVAPRSGLSEVRHSCRHRSGSGTLSRFPYCHFGALPGSQGGVCPVASGVLQRGFLVNRQRMRRREPRLLLDHATSVPPFRESIYNRRPSCPQDGCSCKDRGLGPHVADDLLLTLLYRLSGWRGAYVPRVLARGLAPVDWATYIKQQRRWARSLLDVKFRIFPRISANMSIGVRVIGILQGLTYLQDVVVAICLLVALTGGLIYGVPCPSLVIPFKLILRCESCSAVRDWFVSAFLSRATWAQRFLLAFGVAPFCEVAVYASSRMGRCSW